MSNFELGRFYEKMKPSKQKLIYNKNTPIKGQPIIWVHKKNQTYSIYIQFDIHYFCRLPVP